MLVHRFKDDYSFSLDFSDDPELSFVKADIEALAGIQPSLETALFVEDNWDITPQTTVSTGLRYAYFKVSDSESVAYSGWEPRLSLRHMLSENLKFKLGGAVTNQYLHQVRDEYLIGNFDRWFASDQAIRL